MFDLTHGFIFFLIGCTVTFVGFFIAYMVASKSQKKPRELTDIEKEMLVKELEQDVIEMQEVTKRWESDMSSNSWLSSNIRPLSLAFLTLALFIYVILDSSLDTFKIDEQWISLLGNLLMLVYGGYFGARTLEKIRHK